MAATKSRKPGPGRPKGVPNKVTKDIRAVALDMSPIATQRLKQLLKSDNETVAMAAVREVYDRAFGKATQHVEHSGDVGLFSILEAARTRLSEGDGWNGNNSNVN